MAGWWSALTPPERREGRGSKGVEEGKRREAGE